MNASPTAILDLFDRKGIRPSRIRAIAAVRFCASMVEYCNTYSDDESAKVAGDYAKAAQRIATIARK